MSSCCGVNVSTYEGRQPALDLRDYFNGPLEAEGVFFNRKGVIQRQFHMELTGAWQGNSGTLDEHFIYSNGQKLHRLWKVVMNDDGSFVGSADDLVGNAIGRQCGNASNMKYTLKVPKGNKTVAINMDDWLYKVSDAVVINRVRATKFGFRVGELFITFRKK
ncbi:MAG: DUF3833 domain-containing protein [Micavibrio sp.]|nr:DUF3833 domain-containing protein [Micavibrio sp.]